MTNNTTISVDLGKDVTYELMIERLGGYEKMSKYVKETLADLGNDVPYDTDCYQFETEISFQFGQLQKALLEYRRAHNIYEIGDQIVSTLKGDDIWMQCVCTIEAFHKKMAITNGAGHTIHHYEYRHITNAEREANRRLDTYKKGDSVAYLVTGAKGEFIQYVESPSGHCLVDFGLCDAGLIPLEHLRHATISDHRQDQ